MDNGRALNSQVVDMFSELANRIMDETGVEVLDVAFEWTNADQIGRPWSILARTMIRCTKAGFSEAQSGVTVGSGE